MKLALTTDHAGLELLKQLQTHLETSGHQCTNFGPPALVPDDDYPDYIAPAARAVADGSHEAAIIVGGSGQGEAMVANRFKGVRAAVYYGPAHAVGATEIEGTPATDEFDILRLSRRHNNANVLSLGARFLTPEACIAAVELWLATPYEGVDRHQRRIEKIDKVN
jgi:ribose 5-phosphate isomerase B